MRTKGMKGADKQIKTGQPTERKEGTKTSRPPQLTSYPALSEFRKTLRWCLPQPLGTVKVQTSLGACCMPDSAVGTKDEPLDDDKARGRAAGTGKARTRDTSSVTAWAAT